MNSNQITNECLNILKIVAKNNQILSYLKNNNIPEDATPLQMNSSYNFIVIV